MSIKSLAIFNLDGASPVAVVITALPLTKVSTEDGASFSWKDIEADPFPNGQFPKLYRVDWTDEKGDNQAKGFEHTYENKIFKLSNLEPVGSFGLNINGKLEIKDPAAAAPDAPTAIINVRMGNMGKGTNRQWVIDLSDRQEGNPPSSLNVSALIKWVKAKAKEESEPEIDPEIKTADGTPLKDKLQTFIVNFEQFHFNITKRTFDIDIRSAQGSEITFGAFTLKEVGFQLTNEVKEEKKSEPKQLTE
ncbi:MAG: hypothetical protein WCF67_15915 [Chitinophagaceae bacterium]